MFQIGPMELVVLAVIGLIVIGPDKLPGLAKDAARLIRTLRDVATGAQSSLRKELGDLGPELGDFNLRDLQNLNPRVALTKMIFEDPDDARAASPSANGSGPNRSAPAISGTPTNELPAVPMAPALPADPPAVRPGQAPLGRGEAVPIDDDAT